MERAQFVKLSDLVEDGQLKVDSPEEENKLLKAILYCFLQNISGEMVVFDSNVDFIVGNPEFLNSEMKMEKVDLGPTVGSIAVRFWLDLDSDEGSDY